MIRIRRFIMFAVMLGAAHATFSISASKHPRKPVKDEIATVWRGWVDDLHYCRIELLPEGKGVCGLLEVPANAVSLYSIKSWTLDGYEMKMLLEGVEKHSSPLYIKGEANPVQLFLEFSDGRTNGWKSQVMLRREADEDKVVKITKETMSDVNRSR